MSIYTIGDLHLSFSQNKPMNVFGDNWNGHADKIRKNWIDKVKEEDYVILPGDFSWAMYLKDTYKDFEYLEKLPGNKILLKGNHDYWWGGISKMDEYLKENNFSNINFLYNNAYLIENVLIVGTRGWNLTDSEENEKMLNRECIRLKLSIDYGINKFGNDIYAVSTRAIFGHPSYANWINDCAIYLVINRKERKLYCISDGYGEDIELEY